MIFIARTEDINYLSTNIMELQENTTMGSFIRERMYRFHSEILKLNKKKKKLLNGLKFSRQVLTNKLHL